MLAKKECIPICFTPFACSSYTELLLSDKVGLKGHEIMFSSNVTPAEDFQLASKLDALINFDDITHIDFYEKLAPFTTSPIPAGTRISSNACLTPSPIAIISLGS